MITLPRYYVNKSYKKWKHNIVGKILELGAGKNERYHKDSVTIDITNKFYPDIMADGYCLPFKNDMFDTIIAIEVLEHIEHPTKFIDELYRVLKAEGTFFISTRFFHEIHGNADYYRYTKLSLSTLFNKFGVVHIKEHGSILSVILHLLIFILKLPIGYILLGIFHSVIDCIDKYGTKKICLGYSVFGKK